MLSILSLLLINQYNIDKTYTFIYLSSKMTLCKNCENMILSDQYFPI